MSSQVHNPRAYALALGTLLCAVPLVLFGGSVTTLGAGMAVEGWLVAEGHFLVAFPIEKWFRDTATFVEHTHRLFGVLVGLFAIATVVASFLRPTRRAARVLSVAGLLAVCAQGALGGFRVLESSPELAFLHGVFAQCVFALLAASALVQSRRFGSLPHLATSAAPERRAAHGLRFAALVSAGIVLVQVALGAYYRHGLRPTPEPGSANRLGLHFFGALAVLIAVLWLAGAAKRLAEDHPGEFGALFARQARRLHALLGVQVALGFLAWVGYRPEAVGPLEWFVSIGHVMGGALLLAQVVALWMWSRRAGAADVEPGVSARSGARLGGVH